MALALVKKLSDATPIPPVLSGMPAGSSSAEDKPEVCDTNSAATVRKPEVCGTSAAVCFIKHANACGDAIGGAGSADELPAARIEAYRRAYLGDPNAAMGGILAVNFAVDAGFAAAVMETYQRWGKPLKEAGAGHAPGGFFVEVWIAPRFTDDAVAVIRGNYEAEKARPEPGEATIDEPPKKPWGERVRLLAVGDMSAEPDADEMDFKKIAGGMLVQSRDLVGLNEDEWQVVTERQPTEQELDDLRLAWLVCKHTKSNAITVCKDGRAARQRGPGR